MAIFTIYLSSTWLLKRYKKYIWWMYRFCFFNHSALVVFKVIIFLFHLTFFCFNYTIFPKRKKERGSSFTGTVGTIITICMHRYLPTHICTHNTYYYNTTGTVQFCIVSKWKLLLQSMSRICILVTYKWVCSFLYCTVS